MQQRQRNQYARAVHRCWCADEAAGHGLDCAAAGQPAQVEAPAAALALLLLLSPLPVLPVALRASLNFVLRNRLPLPMMS